MLHSSVLKRFVRRRGIMMDWVMSPRVNCPEASATITECYWRHRDMSLPQKHNYAPSIRSYTSVGNLSLSRLRRQIPRKGEVDKMTVTTVMKKAGRTWTGRSTGLSCSTPFGESLTSHPDTVRQGVRCAGWSHSLRLIIKFLCRADLGVQMYGKGGRAWRYHELQTAGAPFIARNDSSLRT